MGGVRHTLNVSTCWKNSPGSYTVDWWGYGNIERCPVLHRPRWLLLSAYCPPALCWTTFTLFRGGPLCCSGHGSKWCCHLLRWPCLLGCCGLGIALRLGPITASLLGHSESYLGVLETGVWRDMSPFMSGGAGRWEWKPFAGRKQREMLPTCKERTTCVVGSC